MQDGREKSLNGRRRLHRTIEKDQEIKSSQEAALWNNTFIDTDHLHLFQILIISGVSATEAALDHLLDGWHS